MALLCPEQQFPPCTAEIFAAHAKIFDEGHESTRYRCAGHVKWGRPHSAFLLGALGRAQAQLALARPSLVRSSLGMSKILTMARSDP